jgi:hypothetical protein
VAPVSGPVPPLTMASAGHVVSNTQHMGRKPAAPAAVHLKQQAPMPEPGMHYSDHLHMCID